MIFIIFLLFLSTSCSFELSPLENETVYMLVERFGLQIFIPPNPNPNPCEWGSFLICDANGVAQFTLINRWNSFPTEIGIFRNLTSFSISFNPEITGTIPTEIGLLTRAGFELKLSGTPNLYGTIPTEIVQMNLASLIISAPIEGIIPTFIGQLTNLTELSIYSPLFSNATTIPTELSNLRSLQTLSFSAVSGTIPTELGMLSSLQSFYIKNSNLTGAIPREFENLRSLQTWEIGYCHPNFGPFPNISFESLSWLHITECQLGDIPISVLNNVSRLILDRVGLSFIPKLTGVVNLELYEISFIGTIPPEIFTTQLQSIWIGLAEVSGSIPTEIGLSIQLQTVNLKDLDLIGSIPSEIGLLTSLQFLDLTQNLLTGTIPTELFSLSQLISLHLNNNYLEGSLFDEDLQHFLNSKSYCDLLPNNFDCPYPNIYVCHVLNDSNCSVPAPMPTPIPTPQTTLQPTPIPTPIQTPIPTTTTPTVQISTTTTDFNLIRNSSMNKIDSTFSVALGLGISIGLLCLLACLVLLCVFVARKRRKNQLYLAAIQKQLEAAELESRTPSSSSSQQEAIISPKSKRTETLSATIPADLKPLIESFTNDFGIEFYLKNVNKGRKLGAGNFGEVFLADYREGKVAIKSLQAANVKSMKEEVRISALLNSPIVVRVFGVTVLETTMFVVMEYCENGSLLEYVRKTNVTKSQTLVFACRVASAVQLLQENNIIHRDLAARNFLLTESLEVKLSDFGMARQLDKTYYKGDSSTVPIRWSSPEILLHTKYTLASDRYALGVTLWEIFTLGRVPFTSMTNREIIDSAENLSTFPTLPKGDLLSEYEHLVVLGLTQPKVSERTENVKQVVNALLDILATQKIVGDEPSLSITPIRTTPRNTIEPESTVYKNLENQQQQNISTGSSRSSTSRQSKPEEVTYYQQMIVNEEEEVEVV